MTDITARAIRQHKSLIRVIIRAQMAAGGFYVGKVAFDFRLLKALGLQDAGGGLLMTYLTVFSKTIKRDRADYFDIIHVPGSDRQDNQGSYYRFPNAGA